MASKLEAVDLLHKTLGHVSVKRLQEWVSTGQVKWTYESPPVNFVKYSSSCVACSMAKSRRAAHRRTIKTPLGPGQLIYVDRWGPSEVASLLSENVYTIGFIDAPRSERGYIKGRRSRTFWSVCNTSLRRPS